MLQTVGQGGASALLHGVVAVQRSIMQLRDEVVRDIGRPALQSAIFPWQCWLRLSKLRNHDCK